MTDAFVGIHLGNTVGCVAVYQGGKVDVIANDHGNRTTPCFVGFSDEEISMGDAAQAQASKNFRNTVTHMKSMLGKGISDEDVLKLAKTWLFKIGESKDHKIELEFQVKGDKKTYHPEDLCAMILKKLKETAETYMGKKSKRIVVTVPIFFNEVQRGSLFDACRRASLDVAAIIQEPTAGLLACGLDDPQFQCKKVAVFDMGGCYTSATVYECRMGVMEVLSTVSCCGVGGEAITRKLMDHCAQAFKRKTKLDLYESPRSILKLFEACEQAKRSLATAAQVNVEVDSLYEGADLSTMVTRARFDDMINDVLSAALQQLQLCLQKANLNPDQIDEVVLMGGSTRIPKCMKILQDYLHQDVTHGGNPEELAAVGAAIQASLISPEGSHKAKLQTVPPTSMELPMVQHALGISNGQGGIAEIIPRHTLAPYKGSLMISNATENQTSIEVTVVEDRDGDVVALGKIMLKGIAPRPQAQSEINVTFDIDVDGSLNVHCEDIDSNVSASLNISPQ